MNRSIEAAGLVKRFGEFTAVDGIDVEVHRGEAFGFLGPNGAGKSSTMRMIGCTSPVTAGALRVLGLDPATHGRQIRARLGVVPQADQLDNELTVEENLVIYGRYFDIPRAECRRRAAELLEFVQLTERATSKVEPLSGGMKRRLTIARSLINEPELLLLDEPTTGLDPQARHVLWDRLYRLKQQGVTLVLTTHYMDEAEQLCDRLVVMDKGRIVAEGSPRQLIEAHSTREVLELRFAAGTNEAAAPAVEGIGERIEVLPDRILDLRPRRREGAGHGPRPRRRAGERARPPQQPGGRVPPPHRPDPGRLTSDDAGRGPGAGRAASPSTGGSGGRTCSAASSSRCSTCSGWASASARSSTSSRVDRVLGGVDYFAFLAPALIATTAMMVVAQEAMWPVMDGFTWSYSYRAMAATPLRPGEVAGGVGAVARDRGRSSRAGVAVVLVLFPKTRSWGLLPRSPFAVLTGLAFAVPITAWSSTREPATSRSRRSCASASSRCSCSPAPSTRSTSCRTGCSRSPTSTPLCHGVELCRGAVLGTLGAADAVVHVAVLVAYSARRLPRLPRARSPGGWRHERSSDRRPGHGRLRIVPPELLAARRPQRMLERA